MHNEYNMKNKVKEQIGERLKESRKAAGYTQAQIAEKNEYDATAIQQI